MQQVTITFASGMAAISFLGGFLLGHWLALGRDKRREFNEITKPIRDRIIAVREAPHPLHSELFSAADIDLVNSVLPFWQRKRFTRSCNAYKREKNGPVSIGEFGVLYYQDTREMVKQLNRLLSFLNRK